MSIALASRRGERGRRGGEARMLPTIRVMKLNDGPFLRVPMATPEWWRRSSRPLFRSPDSRRHRHYGMTSYVAVATHR